MRMVEEIIGRLPELSGLQLGRLEDELRRERQRRASSAGQGQDASPVQEGGWRAACHGSPGVPSLRGRLSAAGATSYIRRDGSARERGPYWYFQFHEGGKR